MTKRRGGGLPLTGCCVAIGVAVTPGVARAGDAETHDGLYVRLGAGLGYAVDSAETDNVAPAAKIELAPAGFGGATELAVGGSPSPGLVLGGGLYSFWFSPTAKRPKVGGTALDGDLEFRSSSFHVFGPFIDFYPDEGEGFHLQGGLGLGYLSLGDARARSGGVATGYVDTGHDATGLGLMLGIGQEWWVADAWSVGVAGRLTMGFLSGEQQVTAPLLGTVATVDWSDVVLAPALLCTVTMN